MAEVLSKENIKYLPFVVWGLGRAAMEMAIKPVIHHFVDKLTIPSQEELDALILENALFYDLEAAIAEVEG